MTFRERYYSLSPRRRQVLSLISVEGMQNKAIAKALGIHINTAKKHVRDLMQILGADSRLQLAVLVKREICLFDVADKA